MSSPVLFALSANHMFPRGLVLCEEEMSFCCQSGGFKSEVKSEVIKKCWSMVTFFFFWFQKSDS